ncbi:hypothetical protein SPSYN_00577 [Sporotomaculum syntrophicum]|uniref:Uncharacterized protein n=1 Tax=Sporotomaculum syntrophicum TaxID=182264 RepID=A0A9D2WRN8_9FIRM|nr:hypothetical protein [Sporotomaculum syntrophicum]KAF1085848.1 hypothetical protein SPSYN_00577 [Sporotomaculum syntrophicum]
MNRSILNFGEVFPLIIMLVLGKQNPEPWMRRLIDLIDSIQHTVIDMQKGIEMMQTAVYQLVIAPNNNLPQEPSESELDINLPLEKQLPLEQTLKPNYKKPDLIYPEQPLDNNSAQGSATPGDLDSPPSTGINKIISSIEITQPPAVLPAGVRH